MTAARLTAFAAALVLVPSLPPAFAQNTTALNTKAEKLQTEYVRGAVDLATEYEKAGDPAGAIALLEGVQKVIPENAALKSKLDALKNDVLSAGETTLSIEASADWQPVAQVQKGAAFRLAAAGSYRVTMSGSATVDGLPPGDAAAGLTSEAPLGALIGAYVDPSAARNQRGNRDRKQDQPKIFTVGTGGEAERTAEETGLLMVRLNLPAGARPSGKLRVMMSGQITPAEGR